MILHYVIRWALQMETNCDFDLDKFSNKSGPAHVGEKFCLGLIVLISMNREVHLSDKTIAGDLNFAGDK